MEKKRIYRHYGSREYRREELDAENGSRLDPRPGDTKWRCPVKPRYGLWGSPENDPEAFTWKDWNDCEKYTACDEENSFLFSIREDRKILHVYSEDDILPYLHSRNRGAGSLGLSRGNLP